MSIIQKLVNKDVMALHGTDILFSAILCLEDPENIDLFLSYNNYSFETDVHSILTTCVLNRPEILIDVLKDERADVSTNQYHALCTAIFKQNQMAILALMAHPTCDIDSPKDLLGMHNGYFNKYIERMQN